MGGDYTRDEYGWHGSLKTNDAIICLSFMTSGLNFWVSPQPKKIHMLNSNAQCDGIRQGALR